MTRPLPHLPGILTADQVRVTGEHIAGQQLASGLIPWFRGHHGDPWDHVEAAMALTVCGLDDAASLAFGWSAEHQSPDGSWPMETVGRDVRDGRIDTNQCAYLAVGVWHRWLITGDRTQVDMMWPVVRRAMELVVALQLPFGGIAWSRSEIGEVSESALLTGSSCTVMSLRCAMALAELVGDPQPDWELTAARLAHAVAVHPGAFLDKSRYSMDWYYPVLGGALAGLAGRARLDRRWDEFVVPGLGARCVSDRPWVTVAETCELVLSLDAVGDRRRARELFGSVQHLRHDDGGYWTGYVWPDEAVWPEERSTWTAAAVVLAADALARSSPGNGLFRGGGLPALIRIGEADCDAQCSALTGDLA
ncbi:MAG TPA: prenyltransferase [Dermatophilaceae bacterium]